MLVGYKPARAGLSIPSNIFNIIFDIIKNTPVFPADKVTSEFSDI